MARKKIKIVPIIPNADLYLPKKKKKSKGGITRRAK